MFCEYCNYEIATARDHVVPKSWSGNRSFIGCEIAAACSTCNILLSNAPVHTIPERAAYLYEAFMKRYKKELKFPEWTTDELKTVSKTLQNEIKVGLENKRIINEKLKNLRKVGKDFLI